LALILASSYAKAAESLPGCSLEVPVYDARGERLSFRISAVSPEGESGVDLLNTREREYRVVAKGEKLYFQASFIGKRRLQLVLENGEGRKITTYVAITHCQQRTSVEYGGARDGTLGTGDVAYSMVGGRLTGCELVGDWWIRAMPMFGGQDSPVIYEGFIRRDDGVFSIASSHGERHIIVIGKGKQPVRVLAFDVVEGGLNEIGVVDLTGSCSK
jgi:hypothetical protein